MPNSISIGPAVFAGYLNVTSQTDQESDHETSVAIGRIYMLCIYDVAKKLNALVDLCQIEELKQATHFKFVLCQMLASLRIWHEDTIGN